MNVGYCTNVHAGADLASVTRNLECYSLRVKSQVAPNTDMGIGLWLSASSARELLQREKVVEFADRLRGWGLVAFTFNGFPIGDFHQDVVKTNVYQPTWTDPDRLSYTLQLAEIQSRLLDEGGFGTISTLPLGWRVEGECENFFQACGELLRQCAVELERQHLATGRHIFVAIEPEPGCVLDTAQKLAHFFERYLFVDSPTADRVRKYLGVCHDICHSAVMFERQLQALGCYESIGLRVGKIQISSALEARFDGLNPWEKELLAGELTQFAEPRYLHQTTIQSAAGATTFFTDLPDALNQPADGLQGTWRVHFHLPIFLEWVGRLNTTRDEIQTCMRRLGDSVRNTHLEVETYAWSVLPTELRAGSLVDSIVREMRYIEELLVRENLPASM